MADDILQLIPWIRAVTILDFHFNIIVARRIHEDNIIMISMTFFKKQTKTMCSAKFILTFVIGHFISFWKMNHTQNMSARRWKEL